MFFFLFQFVYLFSVFAFVYCCEVINALSSAKETSGIWYCFENKKPVHTHAFIVIGLNFGPMFTCRIVTIMNGVALTSQKIIFMNGRALDLSLTLLLTFFVVLLLFCFNFVFCYTESLSVSKKLKRFCVLNKQPE